MGSPRRKEVSNLIAVKGVVKNDLNSNKERGKKNRKGKRGRENHDQNIKSLIRGSFRKVISVLCF